jgi:choline-sulfatase
MGSSHRWVRTLVPALAAALGCMGQEPEPPNIVLLSVDTLSRAALRPYAPRAGRPLPALEALAAESVRFDAALSTAPWTLPAHASLLTGLYPDRHGATDQRVTLAPATPRLAELLQLRGYETVAFTGGGFLRADYGFPAGFDRYDQLVASGSGRDVELPDAGAPPVPPGRDLFARAVAYLESRSGEATPFFLFLHTFSVHDYFFANPHAVAELPPGDDLPAQAALDCLEGSVACPREVFRRFEALYGAELDHLDAGLDRLLAALRESGLEERTVFVLLSDHGEGFDVSRGRIHHGGRLHADLLLVPFFVRIPGQAPGAVGQPVSLVDVMPTLLELAGAPVPSGLDGHSLLPVLRGEDPGPERTLYAMEYYYAWREGERWRAPAVLARPLLIAAVRNRLWYVRSARGEELYDTGADPEQARNLLDRRARARAAGLEGLRAATDARLRDRPETPPVGDDRELRRELRALGYAE